MSPSLATYVALKGAGTTGEALKHWHEVFGGDLNIMYYGDTPMPDMSFEEAPWGGWYGQVFDRFGVMWAFSCD